MKRFAVLGLALAVTPGCTGAFWGRVLAAGTCDSGNSSNGDSSNGSNDSSNGSKDSSANTNDSLANTNDSSRNTADSSDTKPIQATEDSSRDTSGKSTEQTSPRATTGPVLSTTAVAATVLVVGAFIWRRPMQARTPGELTGAAYAFVRSSATDLTVDLALGAGPSILDLADAAEISPDHLPAFARLLQRNRARLTAFLDPATLSAERAVAFLGTVGDLARADERLALDERAFLARHPQARE